MMTIPSLPFASSPHAILWRVIAVIVDAFNRQIASWAFAHVSKEVLKCVPAFAYFNAASSISMKILDMRIAATLAHRPPNRVFRRVTSAVSAKSIRTDLAVQTAARLRVPGTEGIAKDGWCVTTCASAKPRDLSAVHAPAAFTDNSQSSEGLASQINKPHANILDYLRKK